MDNYTQKMLDWFSNAGEFFLIATALALSVTFLVESWRKNLTYLVAAVTFGTLLGYGVQNVEDWEQFSVLATLLGTITGPATVAAYQKKTAVDLAGDLKDMANKVLSRTSAPYNGYGQRINQIPPQGKNDPRRLPTQGDSYD